MLKVNTENSISRESRNNQDNIEKIVSNGVNTNIETVSSLTEGLSKTCHVIDDTEDSPSSRLFLAIEDGNAECVHALLLQSESLVPIPTSSAFVNNTTTTKLHQYRRGPTTTRSRWAAPSHLQKQMSPSSSTNYSLSPLKPRPILQALYSKSLEWDILVAAEAHELLGEKVESLTPLQLACFLGDEEIALIIMSFCYMEDANTLWGLHNTTLHLACFQGMPDVVAQLLQLGAHPSLKNDKGYRPIDCANDEQIRTIFLTWTDSLSETSASPCFSSTTPLAVTSEILDSSSSSSSLASTSLLSPDSCVIPSSPKRASSPLSHRIKLSESPKELSRQVRHEQNSFYGRDITVHLEHDSMLSSSDSFSTLKSARVLNFSQDDRASNQIGLQSILGDSTESFPAKILGSPIKPSTGPYVAVAQRPRLPLKDDGQSVFDERMARIPTPTVASLKSSKLASLLATRESRDSSTQNLPDSLKFSIVKENKVAPKDGFSATNESLNDGNSMINNSFVHQQDSCENGVVKINSCDESSDDVSTKMTLAVVADDDLPSAVTDVQKEGGKKGHHVEVSEVQSDVCFSEAIIVPLSDHLVGPNCPTISKEGTLNSVRECNVSDEFVDEKSCEWPLKSVRFEERLLFLDCAKNGELAELEKFPLSKAQLSPSCSPMKYHRLGELIPLKNKSTPLTGILVHSVQQRKQSKRHLFSRLFEGSPREKLRIARRKSSSFAQGNLDSGLCYVAVDVNVCNERGLNALHLAAQNNHLSSVKYLVKQGCSLQAIDEDGWTPLHMAALEEHVDIVGYLLHCGADPKAKTHNGESVSDVTESTTIKRLIGEAILKKAGKSPIGSRNSSPSQSPGAIV